MDQDPLFKTGGSTSHAPGLVFQTNSSRTMTRLASDTIELYRSLQWQGQPCFYPVGSLKVATIPQRLEDLNCKIGFTKGWGVKDARLLTPEETLEKSPLIDTNKILGSFFVPGDGIAKAVNICEALAKFVVEQKSAQFCGNTKVTGIETVKGHVKRVITDQGAIETSRVLVCTGIWGPRIGRMVGVPIPLMPMEYLYARTAPLKELAGETREVVHPVVRHQDMSMYFRQQGDAYGFGSYRHEPLPVDPDA